MKTTAILTFFMLICVNSYAGDANYGALYNSSEKTDKKSLIIGLTQGYIACCSNKHGETAEWLSCVTEQREMSLDESVAIFNEIYANKKCSKIPFAVAYRISWLPTTSARKAALESHPMYGK